MQTDTDSNRIQSLAEAPVCDKLQNVEALVIAVAVCVLFSVGFAVSGFSKTGRACELELESRINPNDAPTASLVRLPGIGIGKAAAITAYRENLNPEEPNKPAFKNGDDLQKVRGIGPKTVQNISQCLRFE
ncbi:MAG: ComEA family DNA-binding protein [Planctomycetota bacterium]